MHSSSLSHLALGLALGVACTGTPETDDEAGTTTTGSSDESTTNTNSSSSSDESTVDTSDWSHGSGVSFIDDGFDYPSNSTCDPFAQDCPEGEKCVAYSSDGDTWDANHCVPILGDQAAGEPCTYDGWVEGTDDCDGTSSCLTINADGKDFCRPFCAGVADAPECPPSTSCIIINDGSIALCFANCDPIVQDCPGDEACQWAFNGGFFFCFPTGAAANGEPCEYFAECAAGLYCVDTTVVPDCAGPSCCTEFCDLALGDAQCAAPGTACISFYSPGTAPAGYEDVGVCILPP
jgi:hypothetical protein